MKKVTWTYCCLCGSSKTIIKWRDKKKLRIACPCCGKRMELVRKTVCTRQQDIKGMMPYVLLGIGYIAGIIGLLAACSLG